MTKRATRERVLLSWSSGKDSAWCLHVLRNDPTQEVVGLVTTFNNAADRVAMHAVRRNLVAAQAQACGLPLFPIELPWPCPNGAYEEAMQTGLSTIAAAVGFDSVAFGDLFLADIRAYREQQMSQWGFKMQLPLWGSDTEALAQQMLDAGTRAVLTCVDPKQCPAHFVGRQYDKTLLDELPGHVDPCGENGEFHTFVYGSPVFSSTLPIVIGEKVERDGFFFCDLKERDQPA